MNYFSIGLCPTCFYSMCVHCYTSNTTFIISYIFYVQNWTQILILHAVFLRLWKRKPSSKMGASFYPAFAFWARAEGNVGSRFWMRIFFCQGCQIGWDGQIIRNGKVGQTGLYGKMTKKVKISEVAETVEVAKMANITRIAKNVRRA